MTESETGPFEGTGAQPDLQAGTLAYLERVRLATRRLSSPDLPAGDVRAAIGATADAAAFNVDAPTASARPEGRLAKQAVKRAVGWYMRYLSEQLGDFGRAVLRTAEALADRVELLEGRAHQSEAYMAAVERRLADLEAAHSALVAAQAHWGEALEAVRGAQPTGRANPGGVAGDGGGEQSAPAGAGHAAGGAMGTDAGDDRLAL